MAQDSGRLQSAAKVILVQVLAAILVAGFVYAARGWIAGYSVLLGALTGILPTLLFGYIALKSDDQDAGAILGRFYSGVILKYLLAAALFALVIMKVTPLEPLMVLAGLIVTQLAMVFLPLAR